MHVRYDALADGPLRHEHIVVAGSSTRLACRPQAKPSIPIDRRAGGRASAQVPKLDRASGHGLAIAEDDPTARGHECRRATAADAKNAGHCHDGGRPPPEHPLIR